VGLFEEKRVADFSETVTVSGSLGSLAPLDRAQLGALEAAAADGELWRLWFTNVPAPGAMAAEIERRLTLQETGAMAPFTIVRADGVVAGMTSYMNIDAAHRRLEIGSTWMAASAQRSGLNVQAKRLLLARAFEGLDVIAVEFRTHFMNQRSRRAIERLGAKLDGVLRSHQIARDGSIRDTCVYSITAQEWPAVRSNLDWRLASPT
jgi:RimJ/RimL family protein N-acetyltransferase